MDAPSTDPESWSRLEVTSAFGVTTAPGLVTFRGHDRKIPFDEKAASGQKGATSERKGEDLIKFTSSHLLTDEPRVGPFGVTDDYGLWAFFEVVLATSYNDDEPEALGLYHPDLERQGIDGGAVQRIGGLQRDDDGTGVIEVDWIQYRPPEPTGGAGSSDSPKEKRSPTDDAIDQAIRQIDQLQKEYESL